MTAGIPPPPIAKYLPDAFVARVHVWWPFFPLTRVRRSFQKIYRDPGACDASEKFLVFVILALGANESTEDESYRKMRDMYSPLSYFQTCLRFFSAFSDNSRNLAGLHAVVFLSIWMLSSASSSHSNDLWHLGRYAMSLAVEMGMHRHNTDWEFTAEESEIRNRTWWAVYNLERSVSGPSPRSLSRMLNRYQADRSGHGTRPIHP